MQKRKRLQISNRIKISNTLRTTLIFISIIVFAIGSGNLIKEVLSNNRLITESKEIYNYTNKFSEKADINLISNEYVQPDEMIDGQTYLSDLISTIDLNMSYKYADSRPTDVTYKYKIETTIKATYSNARSTYDILNKTETIKEENEKTVSSKDLAINEKIAVNYSKYHQTIKKFKQEMGINSEAYLLIKMIVETKANVDSQEVNNKYESYYKITLGDKVAIVDEKSSDEISKSVFADSKVKQKRDVNYTTIVINSIVMLLGLLLLRTILKKTEKLNTIKNEYKLELNRILKSCESKLVQIEDLNQIDIEHATRVKDIYQLLKLSDEALVPIYCYIKEEPQNEAYFIVTKYEKSYIYILR